MSPSYTPPNMSGKVPLVAGASRGAGRGIAAALGEAGATVYCTGRSSRATRNSTRSASMRLETVEETAERVTLRGGLGIPAFVDHTNRGAVQMLMARIEKEHGKLDILVNNIWGGDPFLEFGKPFWQLDLPKGFQMMEGALYTHIITCHFAAPLLIESAKKSSGGLIVEVTDGDSYQYRGNLFYDLVKTSVIRMAFAMARELRRKNVTVLALTPGFLLSDEYGFCDADGRKPHWGSHAKKKYGDVMRPCDEGFYLYWTGGMVDSISPNWP